jgi:hypothetical protein
MNHGEDFEVEEDDDDEDYNLNFQFNSLDPFRGRYVCNSLQCFGFGCTSFRSPRTYLAEPDSDPLYKK